MWYCMVINFDSDGLFMDLSSVCVGKNLIIINKQ